MGAKHKTTVQPGMYRSSGDGFVKHVGTAVVQATSQLSEAVWGKGGKYMLCYPFNQTPIGAQPLVLLGHYSQIMAWLDEHHMISIFNDLGVEDGYDPGMIDAIYMSVQMYRPGEKFRGLFPLNDAVLAIIKGTIDVAGGGIGSVYAPKVSAIDLGSIEAAIIDTSKKLDEGGWVGDHMYHEKNKQEAGRAMLYVHFSYCPSAYAQVVARKRLTMRGVKAILARSIGA